MFCDARELEAIQPIAARDKQQVGIVRVKLKLADSNAKRPMRHRACRQVAGDLGPSLATVAGQHDPPQRFAGYQSAWIVVTLPKDHLPAHHTGFRRCSQSGPGVPQLIRHEQAGRRGHEDSAVVPHINMQLPSGAMEVARRRHATGGNSLGDRLPCFPAVLAAEHVADVPHLGGIDSVRFLRIDRHPLRLAARQAEIFPGAAAVSATEYPHPATGVDQTRIRRMESKGEAMTDAVIRPGLNDLVPGGSRVKGDKHTSVLAAQEPAVRVERMDAEATIVRPNF